MEGVQEERLLVPGEPDDAVDALDIEHWISVYTELLQGLTEIAATTPSPELLSRMVAIDARLRWWHQRLAELRQ